MGFRIFACICICEEIRLVHLNVLREPNSNRRSQWNSCAMMGLRCVDADHHQRQTQRPQNPLNKNNKKKYERLNGCARVAQPKMDKLLNKLFLWGIASGICVHVVVTPFDTKRMKIILSEGRKIYDLLSANHSGG